ncbi:unnamed protein product, partial [Bubo scandiacus]
WEQESSRSDAMAFCGKGWREDSRFGEAPSGPVPLTMTPSKDENKQLRGKGVEGRRRRGRLRQRQKHLPAPLGTAEETIKNALNIKYCDEDRNYWQPIIKIWSSRRVLLAIRRLICRKQNFPTTMNIILQFTDLSES